MQEKDQMLESCTVYFRTISIMTMYCRVVNHLITFNTGYRTFVTFIPTCCNLSCETPICVQGRPSSSKCSLHVYPSFRYLFLPPCGKRLLYIPARYTCKTNSPYPTAPLWFSFASSLIKCTI